MNTARESWLQRLPALFEIPAPDPDRTRARILMMERNVMLPVKAFFIGIILYSFKNSAWGDPGSTTPAVAVETMQIISWYYIPVCLVLALPLLFERLLPLAVLQWTVVTSTLVDALEIAGMCVITGGQDSILFWLFVGLILRNAVSVPPGFSQIFLNSAISLSYVLVATLTSAILANTESTIRKAMEAYSPNDELGEPFVLRLFLLLLMTASCHGVQAFLEKQRVTEAEAAESALRENQLRAAGRLAAEFAHQIKNPLAIINNSAHSLRRSLHENPAAAATQIEIIQEEVARADRVITQIMGYAQLTEGRVEKLGVSEELNRAIDRIFPAAVPTGIRIRRDFAAHFPPLLMQRGHFTEIIGNLLQNAREALGQQGTVTVTAECARDLSVLITVADDGPGIPPDHVERIFEAYYTTKEKGTGLGLAIVKHNAELYGGTVRLESVLGKGAKFMVTFPAKTLPKPFAK